MNTPPTSPEPSSPPTRTITLTENQFAVIWFFFIIGWWMTILFWWTVVLSYPDGIVVVLTNEYGEMMWEIFLYGIAALVGFFVLAWMTKVLFQKSK